MIKLPSDQVLGLIEMGVGLPLAKPGQRPMREWVLVPVDGQPLVGPSGRTTSCADRDLGQNWKIGHPVPDRRSECGELGGAEPGESEACQRPR